MSRVETDEATEHRIHMEIIVDCYGEEERAMGWYCYLQDKLTSPFLTQCITKRATSPLKVGDKVEVLGMAPDEECEREMFVVMRWEKGGLAIPLSQLEVIHADDDGETEQAACDWLWIPPKHIQEIRTLMRLRHTMIEERTSHKQRIHAQIFHNGYPQQKNLDSMEGRAYLEEMELPAAARQVVDLSLAMIEHINEELEPIEAQLRAYAGSQAGCQALMEHYGVGELASVALLCELGDTRRFSSSRKAVRYAGMDVTVHSSDEKRAAGKLSRQGPPVLRWAAFEVAKRAWRKGSPDHDYYLKNKERIGANRAALAIARKLIRRAHHTLRELGEEAMSEPVSSSSG